MGAPRALGETLVARTPAHNTTALGVLGTPRRCRPACGRRATARTPTESFRPHDRRESKITNDRGNQEIPGEVSADARHHSPGSPWRGMGRRRAEGAKKPAPSSAGRLGLSSLV
ncbi:hypothetical protein [Streptomyces sp. WMMC905]|uniref:hypothetical protein n=1 Tax=Streptomyces sp. WMMC905 TaxID=3404123 RepID=UPI003B928DB3